MSTQSGSKLRLVLISCFAAVLLVGLALAIVKWHRARTIAKAIVLRHETELRMLRESARRFDEARGRSTIIREDGTRIDSHEAVFGHIPFSPDVLQASISSEGVGMAYSPPGVEVRSWSGWFTGFVSVRGIRCDKGVALIDHGGFGEFVHSVQLTGRVRTASGKWAIYRLVVKYP